MPNRSSRSGVDRVGSKFIIREYNRVVHSAELQDIRLVASEFSVSPEYYKREDDMELALSDKIAWINVEEEKRVAMANLQWSASCTRDAETLLTTNGSYVMVYSFSEDAEIQYIKAFIRNVGRFAVYPYFRALVAHFSSAASAHLPILPVIKQPIAAPPDDDPEEEQRQAKARKRLSRQSE